jgi:hypothetical protein
VDELALKARAAVADRFIRGDTPVTRLPDLTIAVIAMRDSMETRLSGLEDLLRSGRLDERAFMPDSEHVADEAPAYSPDHSASPPPLLLPPSELVPVPGVPSVSARLDEINATVNHTLQRIRGLPIARQSALTNFNVLTAAGHGLFASSAITVTLRALSAWVGLPIELALATRSIAPSWQRYLASLGNIAGFATLSLPGIGTVATLITSWLFSERAVTISARSLAALLGKLAELLVGYSAPSVAHALGSWITWTNTNVTNYIFKLGQSRYPEVRAAASLAEAALNAASPLIRFAQWLSSPSSQAAIQLFSQGVTADLLYILFHLSDAPPFAYAVHRGDFSALTSMVTSVSEALEFF